MLKYVVQHFGFVHYSEVSIGREPFCEGLETSLRVGVVVNWCDEFFLRQ